MIAGTLSISRAPPRTVREVISNLAVAMYREAILNDVLIQLIYLYYGQPALAQYVRPIRVSRSETGVATLVSQYRTETVIDGNLMREAI